MKGECLIIMDAGGDKGFVSNASAKVCINAKWLKEK